MTIKELIDRSHKNALEKGWWDNKEDHNVPTKLALMHSEISEALEAYREGSRINHISIENGKPEGFIVELADLLIRVADFVGHYNLPLEEALQKKMDYNRTRPYRHHGKQV